MRSLLQRVWPWMAAITSGLLLTLCFAPYDQGWLVWIALTPLLSAVWSERGRHLRPVLLGYVSGLVFFTGAFIWLQSLAELFHAPALLGLSVLLGLYMGIYFAFWAWFVGRIAVRADERFISSPRNLAIGFVAASAWVATEWVRGWILYGGWGWNGLGVALHRDLAMIQIADITGVLGISWLVAFCNVMAVIVVRRIAAELGPTFLKRIRWEFSFTMALVALVFSYGVRTLILVNPSPQGPSLRVVTIQPNIPQQQKDDPESQEEVIAQIMQLTSLAASNAQRIESVKNAGVDSAPGQQLMLWPEAAISGGDRDFFDQLRSLMEGDRFDLLMGTMDYEADAAKPDQMRSYNAAALLTRDQPGAEVYRKMHLVPFGEFLPLRPIMPQAVQALVPGDLSAGTGAKVLRLREPALDLGVLICFEDTLGDLTRAFVQKGADLLVNVTNDGWFLRTAAAEQHLANAVFRAVENRRPLVRCANTGVTCAVDATGRIDRQLLPKFTQGFATFQLIIPTAVPLTFYTRHGDWVGRLGCAVVAGFLLVRGLQRLRRRGTGAIEAASN